MIVSPKPAVVSHHPIITGPVSSITVVSQPDPLHDPKPATGCHNNVSTDQSLSQPVIVITSTQHSKLSVSLITRSVTTSKLNAYLRLVLVFDAFITEDLLIILVWPISADGQNVETPRVTFRTP